MNELRAILKSWRTADAEGQSAALATVVHVKGSAYRRPGARMLMTADGRKAGMISGGCLDEDVLERAQRVMVTGQPRVVTYDSTAPEDIVFGLGLGCNGVVKVLIERLSGADSEDFKSFLNECSEHDQTGRIATIFEATASSSVKPGARLLRWPDGKLTGSFDHPELTASLIKMMDDTAGRRTAVRTLELQEGGTVCALIETIAPPVSLVIFGAGQDAIPLANLAKLLGWRVDVIDHRPAYALAERFPTADSVQCLRANAVVENACMKRSPHPAVMIMSHNFTNDKNLLQVLLPLKLPYIGILGPKSRTQRLLDDLTDEGITFSEECLSSLHGPAGLDIGSETSEEIAVSILAEIRAVLANRTGGLLRWRTGAIHDDMEPMVVAQ